MSGEDWSDRGGLASVDEWGHNGVIRFELEQAWYGEGFTTGNLLELGGNRLYQSVLCVLGPFRRSMSVYAVDRGPV